MQASAFFIGVLIGLSAVLTCLSGCHKAAKPPKSEPFAQVTEMRQRSVNEDPAVMGNFPNNWQLEKPAGSPMPAEESEIGEFQERLAKIQIAPVVLEDLAPGATRKVDLPLGGPSGLSGVVRWIGTTNPL